MLHRKCAQRYMVSITCGYNLKPMSQKLNKNEKGMKILTRIVSRDGKLFLNTSIFLT